MTTEEIRSKVINVISYTFGIPETSVNCTDDVAGTMSKDSLDLVELVLALEGEFTIDLRQYEDQIPGMTVNKLIETVEERLKTLDMFKGC